MTICRTIISSILVLLIPALTNAYAQNNPNNQPGAAGDPIAQGTQLFNTKGFTTPGDTLTVDITANAVILPVNTTLADADPGSPYTNTFTVLVRDDQGLLFPAQSISIDQIGPGETGALYFLDGDPDHEDGNGNPLAFRRLVFENTSGIVTGHFHAFNQPGTVTLLASVLDPVSSSLISDSLDIQVTIDGAGANAVPTLGTGAVVLLMLLLSGVAMLTGNRHRLNRQS